MSRKIMLVLAIIVVSLVVVPVASAGFVYDEYEYPKGSNHWLDVIVQWHDTGYGGTIQIDQIQAKFRTSISSYVDMAWVETLYNGSDDVRGDITQWHVINTKYVTGSSWTTWTPGSFPHDTEGLGAAIKLQWGSMTGWCSQLAWFFVDTSEYQEWR